MYYEEKMIGGKLKYRITPNGQWEECSIDLCWNKISALQDEIIDLKAALRSCANSAQGALTQYAPG